MKTRLREMKSSRRQTTSRGQNVRGKQFRSCTIRSSGLSSTETSQKEVHKGRTWIKYRGIKAQCSSVNRTTHANVMWT